MKYLMSECKRKDDAFMAENHKGQVSEVHSEVSKSFRKNATAIDKWK